MTANNAQKQNISHPLSFLVLFPPVQIPDSPILPGFSSGIMIAGVSMLTIEQTGTQWKKARQRQISI
jgi:hypothetical protein